MAGRLPDGLTLERNRDLRGRSGHAWYRRALLCLIAALPVLALLNVFGQRPTVSSAHAIAADLQVTAPARLRSGLIFQVRSTFKVNPTNVGKRREDVALQDGTTVIATVHRSLTIFP